MANGTIAASQLEMLSLSGTGIITITPPATNTNRAITLPDAAGALVVSGTTPSLNGITFPATQVPSADANTLDDYEEGTWTPTVAFGGASSGITYSAQVARYTKVGNLVTVSCFINMTAKGSSTGFASISNLPFTSANTTSLLTNGVIRLANVTFADYVQGYLPNNSTVFGLEEITNAGTGTGLTDADFSNTSNVMLNISYGV